MNGWRLPDESALLSLSLSLSLYNRHFKNVTIIEEIPQLVDEIVAITASALSSWPPTELSAVSLTSNPITGWYIKQSSASGRERENALVGKTSAGAHAHYIGLRRRDGQNEKKAFRWNIIFIKIKEKSQAVAIALC